MKRIYGLGRVPSAPDARDFRLKDFIPWRHRLFAGFYTEAVLWELTAMLNQMDTPHCTAFSAAHFGNCLPVDARFTSKDAHAMYYEAKEIDGEPKQENGSTIRTIAKVLKNRGRIDGYAFADTLYQIKTWLLTKGSVVVGTDWYSSMDKTNSDGFVKVKGYLEGGHAYLCVGFSPQDDVLIFANSWGTDWGKKGFFKMYAEEWKPLFENYGEALTAVELDPEAKQA